MAHNVVTTGFSMYNPRRLERMAYGAFEGAGIDLFTDPTAQDPNKFHDLTNVMPSITGGFNRRWGMNQVTGSVMPFTTTRVSRMFSYAAAKDTSFSGTADTRLLLGADGTTVASLLNEVNSPSYNLTAFHTIADIWGITSRSWFYACNGNDNPRKIDYSQHSSNTYSRWGIPRPGGAGFLAIASPDGTGYIIVTGGNTYLDLEPSITNNWTSYYADGVVGSGFTSVPTISFSGGGGSGATATATLYHDGIVDVSVTSGGTGYTSAPTVTVTGGGGSVGHLKAVVDAQGIVNAVVMDGPVVLNSGRTYAAALKNSVTGHTSDFLASNYPLHYLKQPLGVTYNPTDDPSTLLNQGCDAIIVPLSIPSSSIDPQVDTVVLLATSDGGDLGHLYEVAQIPLSSFTLVGSDYHYVYRDTLADTYTDNVTSGSTLLTKNLWVDTSADGSIVGINDNTPPGTFITKPVINQGRMFATDGKSVYYSKSIEEVTTSTGLITSKWEEAWPGTNVLDIAYDDEEITGLLSDGEILYIGTKANIFRLLGNSASNFSIPTTIFRGVGVKSQDTWSVVYKDNLPAGYMWVTTDDKIMFSDFNTYNEVGKPIYPLLQTLGTVTHITSLSYGPYSFAVLAVSNDTYFTYLLYDTKNGGWYLWQRLNEGNYLSQVSGCITPLFSYTDVTGVQRLYTVCAFGATGSYQNNLKTFDPTTTWDWNAYSDNVDTIPWSIETSWLCLKDVVSDNVLNELELWSDDTGITIDVYKALTSADFGTPVSVKSGTPTTTPFGQKFMLAGNNSFGRFHKFRFSVGSTSGPIASHPTAVLRQFQVEFFPQTRS